MAMTSSCTGSRMTSPLSRRTVTRTLGCTWLIGLPPTRSSTQLVEPGLRDSSAAAASVGAEALKVAPGPRMPCRTSRISSSTLGSYTCTAFDLGRDCQPSVRAHSTHDDGGSWNCTMRVPGTSSLRSASVLSLRRRKTCVCCGGVAGSTRRTVSVDKGKCPSANVANSGLALAGCSPSSKTSCSSRGGL